jgi:hypothetical protein
MAANRHQSYACRSDQRGTKAPIFGINLTPSARQWAAQLHRRPLALRLFATGEERNINSQRKKPHHYHVATLSICINEDTVEGAIT